MSLGPGQDRPRGRSAGNPLQPAIGVVLAGGRGRRIGGQKASAQLRGRPLISYPVGTLRKVLDDVVVVGKADTELPALDGVEVWTEPQLPRHPLAGIIAALIRSGGRSVVVCACDMPMVTAETFQRLAGDERAGQAAIVCGDGRWQPLLACYRPTALDDLTAQLERDPDRSLQSIIGGLDWLAIDVDPAELFNVNTPAELLQAAARLERRSGDGR